MGRHMRLYKYRRDFRVNAGRDVNGGAFTSHAAKFLRVLLGSYSVQIHHAVEAIVVILYFQPIV